MVGQLIAVKSAIAVRVVCGGSELGEYGVVFVNCKPSLKKENISKCLQKMLPALIVIAAKSDNPSRVSDKFTKSGTKQNIYFQLEKLLP